MEIDLEHERKENTGKTIEIEIGKNMKSIIYARIFTRIRMQI
jgi:hypothetical protein